MVGGTKLLLLRGGSDMPRDCLANLHNINVNTLYSGIKIHNEVIVHLSLISLILFSRNVIFIIFKICYNFYYKIEIVFQIYFNQ